MVKPLLGDDSSPAPTDPSVTSVTSVTDVPARVVTTESPERFLLIADFAGRCLRLEIVAQPQVAQAAAWECNVRRISKVVLCRTANGWTARATLIGHRRTTCRSISIGTALALARRGHRVSVCGHTLTTSMTSDHGVQATSGGS